MLNYIFKITWLELFCHLVSIYLSYGIRRCLIGVGSITEVKQRRVRIGGGGVRRTLAAYELLTTL